MTQEERAEQLKEHEKNERSYHWAGTVMALAMLANLTLAILSIAIIIGRGN